MELRGKLKTRREVNESLLLEHENILEDQKKQKY